MKLALFASVLTGNNSGDGFIADGVRRIVQADEYRFFPLLVAPSDEQIAEINSCDAAIICGTNLYQKVFACALTADIVERIRVPLIPFGVGTSAKIGQVPKMRAQDVETVRAIHRKCAVSGVRDGASLEFLHSIGVKNTLLTGCPVLFHGLQTPKFDGSGQGACLAPRLRLLHTDPSWMTRQEESLDLLCARYRPTLVLQSPYDIDVATRLSQKYGVPIVMDPKWQSEPYVQAARETAVSFGFRLHFAMLCLSYGKPSFMVAHDSRVSEFCRMMNLRCFPIQDYSDNDLMLQIDSRSMDASGFCRRWDALARTMNHMLEANGLRSRIEVPSGGPVHRVARSPKPSRHRVCMLMDKRGWAFDHSARQIARLLAKDFKFNLEYKQDKKPLNPKDYDLLYVFFWGEEYHKQFGFSREQVIKELSSHRWQDDPRYGPCTPAELVERHLKDAGTVICTSLRLLDTIAGLHPRAYHTPNGFDPARFRVTGERTGAMTVGWAGKAADGVKGIKDILRPACEGRFKLLEAGGEFPHSKMNEFYNSLDVFAVASLHEGEPLTLVEAMAAGCFPVCVDVGIVPELIRSGHNGLIVAQRTPEAFREALEWCEANIEQVRHAGKDNAAVMARERSWQVTAPYFKRAFLGALGRDAAMEDLGLEPVKRSGGWIRDALACIAGR